LKDHTESSLHLGFFLSRRCISLYERPRLFPVQISNGGNAFKRLFGVFDNGQAALEDSKYFSGFRELADETTTE
jgi:hypothetical protein